MRFPLAALLLAATGALAQTPPATPKLTFLYSLNCTLGASLDVGATPVGSRRVIPITGGTFSGPKISGTSPPSLHPNNTELTDMRVPGKVFNLGADWGLIDAKGTFSADTRYHLQTDDGAHIFIRTSGPAQADGRLHLRLVFETGSDKYYWLNNIVAVGILKVVGDTALIDAWMLEGN